MIFQGIVAKAEESDDDAACERVQQRIWAYRYPIYSWFVIRVEGQDEPKV